MIGKLPTYLGVGGILAILVYAAALVVIAMLVVRRRQPLFYIAAYGLVLITAFLGQAVLRWADFQWPDDSVVVAVVLAGIVLVLTRRVRAIHWAAIGLALAGFFLADLNSTYYVQVIREDISEALKAAEEARRLEREKELRKLRDQAADIAFAEDTAADPLDLAGVEKAKVEKVMSDGTVVTVTDEGEAAPPGYAYRERGKQGRDPNAERVREGEEKALTEQRLPPSGDEAAPAEHDQEGISLPPQERQVAQDLDVANLFAARSVLWVAVLMVLVDYVRQFNRTVGSHWTVPIAGRVVDALSPKTHAVRLTAPAPEAVARYIEDVVRKGETFLYFGPDDPWPDRQALHRVAVRGRSVAWPLAKLVYGPGPLPVDETFVFESAWFGRYGVVLRGEERARQMLDALLSYLDRKHRPRARARRSVHVVWDFMTPLDDETFDELAYLASEANLKLVVVARSAPGAADAARFDECVDLSAV